MHICISRELPGCFYMIIYCRSETAAAIEAGIEYSDEQNTGNTVKTESADELTADTAAVMYEYGRHLTS